MCRRLFPFVSLFAVLLTMAGCASPRFETVVRRMAPEGPGAQACLARCEQTLEACKADCSEKYQACLKQAEPEAEDQYRQALDHYAQELDRYRRELDFYDMRLWTSYNWRRGAFWYEPFPYPGMAPPIPPAAPGRGEVTSRFLESRCGGDCGCQPPYDACFQACGGRIETETRCVAHCPEGR